MNEGLSSEAPVPQAAPDAAREALHRLIEDGLAAGKTRAEDALLVAKYQDRLLEAPVPQREPLTDEQVDKIARDDSSGKSLEAMTGLMLAVLNAGTNGAALAAVARFRKDERIEAIKAAVRALSVAQTATPQGDQFEYVGYVDDGDVLKYGDAPANNSCHVYRKLGPVIDLANPGRPRMAILKDMLDRGEITAEQYRREERGEASESKASEPTSAERDL